MGVAGGQDRRLGVTRLAPTCWAWCHSGQPEEPSRSGSSIGNARGVGLQYKGSQTARPDQGLLMQQPGFPTFLPGLPGPPSHLPWKSRSPGCSGVGPLQGAWGRGTAGLGKGLGLTPAQIQSSAGRGPTGLLGGGAWCGTGQKGVSGPGGGEPRLTPGASGCRPHTLLSPPGPPSSSLPKLALDRPLC